MIVRHSRWLQLMALNAFVIASGPVSARPTVEHPRPPPQPFCVTCRIVDLNAVVGGGAIDVVPTAINNADQIVGYDGGVGPDAGTAVLVDSNTSYTLFGRSQYLAFTVPTAISNYGKSLVGDTIVVQKYGQLEKLVSVWTVATPLNVTLNYFGYPYTPDGDLDIYIASNDVPITGRYAYAFTSFVATKFPTSGCAITNFQARAINDSGTIVGSGGGNAAYGSTTACAKPIAFVRPANGFSEAHGINSAGDMLVSITGGAAPAYGAEYLLKGGRLLRIVLPSTIPSASTYLVSRGISDGDEVVGDIRLRTPPFASVAPFLYRNGASVDLNSLLPRNSGWTLLTAAGVSVGGRVIGNGLHNGVPSGYALQP